MTGVMLTFGSVVLPETLWADRVCPVSRIAWPPSSVRVAESSGGAVTELYV